MNYINHFAVERKQPFTEKVSKYVKVNYQYIFISMGFLI